MKARITASSFLAALALALPAAASAQEEGSVVPPENSAATQYTEAVPSAGGDKESGGRHKAPAKVLGSKNAHKLQSQGKDGRAVAGLVAETAPETSPPAESGQRAPAPPEQTGHGQANGNGAGDGNGGPGSGNANRRPEAKPPTAEPAAPTSAGLPDGSSGLGEVIGAATGSSSSGGIGLLLPLAIVVAIAWALAYLWQQRRPAE